MVNPYGKYVTQGPAAGALKNPSGPGSAPEGLMPRREALQAGGWAGGCSGVFRIIPGSAPQGAPPRRAGFIPFRGKSLTGFNAPLEFLTGFTLESSILLKNPLRNYLNY